MDQPTNPAPEREPRPLPPLFLQIIDSTLDRLNTQGLDARTAANARACMHDLVALVNRYGVGALVAVGMLEGVLDQLGGDLSELVANHYHRTKPTTPNPQDDAQATN